VKNHEHLFMNKKNGWNTENKDKIFSFCTGYKAFLNKSKTEREYTRNAVLDAVARGFKPLDEIDSLSPGDKVYRENRGKGILLAVIGSEDIENGINLVGAHIDSPRLDLKQNPLYEDGEMALFKTHYYGGIKKYQWTTIPLEMHGVFAKADGSTFEVSAGGADDDFTFTISDLLPHLAVEQSEKKLKEAIEGESLNILVSSIPAEGEDIKEPVKLAVLKYLNENYGITETDFVSAEIEFVPAFEVKDVGFDRGMIGGPGQDDRVCAYTSMIAAFEVEMPKRTAVCYLVDKEEIGSMGNTGMKSRFFENTMAEICALLKKDYSDLTLRRCLSASKCLSADVCAAFDPNYPSVLEKNNMARAGYGVTIVKYTGSRGKSGSNDASAEFVRDIVKAFDDSDVLWQTSELGKVDLGGGGTIAQYVANLNIDTIDCGVPLLSMHSPFELSSKLDVYMAYRAYFAFLNTEF